MLKYLEDSEDLKVSLRELKEQLESPEEAGTSIMQIAKQSRNERGHMLFQIFRQEENEVYIASLARWDAQLKAQDQAPLKSWHWKAVVEKKAHRGRLWNMLGKGQFIQGMCECFSLERAKAKKFLKDAEKEKQEGIQGPK